jgi:hypothetical protein
MYFTFPPVVVQETALSRTKILSEGYAILYAAYRDSLRLIITNKTKG